MDHLWLDACSQNDVANCGRLLESIGHGKHIYTWFLSTLTVLLINKTKFFNPCHALKNSTSVAVKGSRYYIISKDH